jgi:hypothetical protein
MRQKNAAMTLALDEAVGRVMRSLRDSGQEENTLVVFISDNGAALIKGSAENGGSNAPLRGSKIECWEGGIRIPFLAQWKGRIAEGRTTDEPVCSLDLLPTLLAAAESPLPAGQKTDGHDLLPWLSQQTPFPDRGVLCWKLYDNNFAIREGDMKFVHVGKKSGLFNVRKDPSETNDLAEARPILARQLEAKWKEWNKLRLAQK